MADFPRREEFDGVAFGDPARLLDPCIQAELAAEAAVGPTPTAKTRPRDLERRREELSDSK